MMLTSSWTSPGGPLDPAAEQAVLGDGVGSPRPRSPSISAWFTRTFECLLPTEDHPPPRRLLPAREPLDHGQRAPGTRSCTDSEKRMSVRLRSRPGAVGVALGDEGALMGGVSRWSGVRSVVPSYRRMYQDGPAKLNKSPSIRGPAFAADPGRTTARPDPDRDDHERPTRPRRLARARDDPRGAGRRGPPGRGRESAASRPGDGDDPPPVTGDEPSPR